MHRPHRASDRRGADAFVGGRLSLTSREFRHHQLREKLTGIKFHDDNARLFDLQPARRSRAVHQGIFSWNDFFYALIVTRTKAMTAPVAMINFL
jgi:hypothetical protein